VSQNRQQLYIRRFERAERQSVIYLEIVTAGVVCGRPPENNPFYSSIDIMPELRLARRKSMTLVSDLVSHD